VTADPSAVVSQEMTRAVQYSYLDFTTLAWRQAACEADVAFHRRTGHRMRSNSNMMALSGATGDRRRRRLRVAALD
jgi:aminoglycoside phosphotransferase family enzyme